MKPTPKNQEGFSILEIVITLLIVAVILILYNAAMNLVFVTANTADQELAVRIASNQIETLRATAFGSLPSSGTVTGTLLSLLRGGQAGYALSTYSSSTKAVTVSVSWQERGNYTRQTISLTTLITKIGGLP